MKLKNHLWMLRHDPYGWVCHHSVLAVSIHFAVRQLEPIWDTLQGIAGSVDTDRKIKAIRKVTGDTGEIKYWKWDGSTDVDVYMNARRHGWTGKLTWWERRKVEKAEREWEASYSAFLGRDQA